MAVPPDCRICQGEAFDREIGRIVVWSDRSWRLATSLVSPVLGLSYLEPIRHVPHITDLDGPEAVTFGPTLARLTRTLKEVTGAELVYVTIFGAHIPHLHVHLAPHRAGDALTGGPGMIDPASGPLPRDELAAMADRIRTALA